MQTVPSSKKRQAYFNIEILSERFVTDFGMINFTFQFLRLLLVLKLAESLIQRLLFFFRRVLSKYKDDNEVSAVQTSGSDRRFYGDHDC